MHSKSPDNSINLEYWKLINSITIRFMVTKHFWVYLDLSDN